MDFLVTTYELNIVEKVIIITYVLGIFFCIYLKGIIKESSLNKYGSPVRYSVLFIIWLLSPAVLVGLIWVTISSFSRKHYGKKD